nr:MAG TPA: hypothetical protein [Crassvirales sp.]
MESLSCFLRGCSAASIDKLNNIKLFHYLLY